MGWNLRNFFSKVNTSLPKPDPRPPFHDASQRRRLRKPTVTAAQTTHTNTLFSTFFVDSSADASGNRYRSSLVFEEGPFGPIPPMNDLPGTGEYRVRKAYPRVDNSVPPFSAPPAVTSHRPHVLTRKPRTRFVSMPAPQRDYPNLDDEAGYWPTDPPRPNAQTLRHRPPIPTTADLDGMRRRAMSHPPSSWNEQTLHKASGPRTVGERRPLRTFSNDPRRIGTINRQFRIYDGTLMADGAGYVDTVRETVRRQRQRATSHQQSARQIFPNPPASPPSYRSPVESVWGAQTRQSPSNRSSQGTSQRPRNSSSYGDRVPSYQPSDYVRDQSWFRKSDGTGNPPRPRLEKWYREKGERRATNMTFPRTVSSISSIERDFDDFPFVMYGH